MKAAIAIAFLAVIVSIISMLLIAAGIRLSDELLRREKFMSSCIEFHSADRCNELWLYKRQDLVKP